MMVSAVAIAGMVFTLLVSVSIPVVGVLWVRRKTGHAVRTALVGALCFFVSAMVLEQILHILVLPRLQNMPWAYVAYACLAAGVFEETGRLVGLSILCKKNPGVATGAAYGFGHGGIEAILTAGIASLANLMFVFTYQINNTSVPVQQTADLMRATPELLFWVGGIERISAIALHFALSILIWMVVTKRLRFYWYFVAIGLHALTNLSAGMYQKQLLKNLPAVEVIVFVTALAVCMLVAVLYRRTRSLQSDVPETAVAERAAPELALTQPADDDLAARPEATPADAQPAAQEAQEL